MAGDTTAAAAVAPSATAASGNGGDAPAVAAAPVVELYVLGMNRSASLGQCRPWLAFFEQLPMSSVRDVCMVSSDESLSLWSKMLSSALYRLETTIPAALGRSS